MAVTYYFIIIIIIPFKYLLFIIESRKQKNVKYLIYVCSVECTHDQSEKKEIVYHIASIHTIQTGQRHSDFISNEKEIS